MAREVTSSHPGSNVFEIGLQLRDGTIITMRIALGKSFPRSAPVVQMLSQCTHPWLSTDGYCRVVGHAGLNSWGTGSNLGRVVHEIVAEFCKRPPLRAGAQASRRGGASTAQQTNGSQQPSYPTPSSRSSSSGSRDPPPSYEGKQERSVVESVGSDTQFSQLPKSYPEVEKLSEEELAKLLDDDIMFSDFCSGISAVSDIEKILDAQLEKNNDVAKRSLEKEEELSALKDEIKSLRDVLTEKEAGYEQLLNRQRVLLQRSSPAQLILRVEESCDEIEMESEELADEFLKEDYDGSSKNWIKEFMRIRKVLHRRKAIVQSYKTS